MPEAYIRQSSFSNGDVIDATLFNAEYDQLEAAFGEVDGHKHDGTTGGGAPVPFIEKETSGVYIDTSVPASPKIVFKLGGVVVNTFGDTFEVLTNKIQHTPADSGIPVALNSYLDNLEIYLQGLEGSVGDASQDAIDAAQSAQAAAVSAHEAQAAAMAVGVPIVLADGATYTISNTTVVADITCMGNATINLPTVLTKGYRYSVRVSSLASFDKQCVIVNPSFSIVGDIMTVTAGNNLVLKRKDVAILDAISTNTLEII